jgi:hypothetical protein
MENGHQVRLPILNLKILLIVMFNYMRFVDNYILKPHVLTRFVNIYQNQTNITTCKID